MCLFACNVTHLKLRYSIPVVRKSFGFLVSFSGADVRLNCEDLTSLSQLTEELITTCLENRFNQSEIYTYIGSILISVNPYKPTGLYTKEIREKLAQIPKQIGQ